MPNLAKLRYASPRASSLAEDLRRAAHDHLQAHGDHRFADVQFIAKGTLLVVVSALLYGVMMTATGATTFVLAYMAFPFIAMLLAMNVLHDGAHRALSPGHGWTAS